MCTSVQPHRTHRDAQCGSVDARVRQCGVYRGVDRGVYTGIRGTCGVTCGTGHLFTAVYRVLSLFYAFDTVSTVLCFYVRCYKTRKFSFRAVLLVFIILVYE